MSAYGLDAQELQAREIILARTGAGRIESQDAGVTDPFSDAAAVDLQEGPLVMRERSRSLSGIHLKRSFMFGRKGSTAGMTDAKALPLDSPREGSFDPLLGRL
jgi:hypothetical protein